MRAHLLQYDIAWEDKPANHERVRVMLGGTDVAPGDLVLLPEMFDTGFSINLEATARDPERSMAFLHAIASETGATVVGGVSILGTDGRGRNRLVVSAPAGETIATYDKIHPFSFGREGERFDGGELVRVFDWVSGNEELRVGLAVCYDLRFPELFRRLVDEGAEAFVVIANWPAPRADHWRALMFARAIENQAFALGVNRTGADPHLEYTGGSLGVDPKGRLIGEASAGEGALTLELAPTLVRRWRSAFPALRDRRLGAPGASDPVGI
jgi:omega-amidase